MQLLETEDNVCTTKDTDMIIELQQWHPSTWVLEQKTEISIDKECTLDQLRAKITEMFSIPFDHVSITKPRRFQLKEVCQLPLLSWQSTGYQLLSDAPFHVQDG